MRIAAVLLIVLTAILTTAAAVAAERVSVPVETWLTTGPAPAVLPAFHDESPGGVALSDLLDFAALDVTRLWPRAGENGWAEAGTKKGTLRLEADGAAEAWLAVYIEAKLWVEPTLELSGEHPAKVWLDGEALELEDGDDARTADLKLTMGLHRLVVRALHDPEVDEPWRVGAALGLEADVPEPAFTFSTDPTRAVDIRDVLDYPRISSPALSPDGALVALSLGAFGPDGEPETWLEIRDTGDGALLRSWRGAGHPGRVQWLPSGGSGRAVSYTSADDGKTTLWVYDLDTETITPALRDAEHFEGYAWNPDGRSLVYAYGVEAEDDERQVKRLEAVEDRWPWWRNRSYLVETTWPGGASRRLTAGDVSASSWTFSPAGTHLLFSRTWPDPQVRPYSRTEWFELDLGDLSVETVLTDRWVGQAGYGPDRDTLVLIGSPSAFDGLGRDLPEGVVPNDYGGQLFLYDRKAATATPLSRDFDPTVQQAAWHEDGFIVTRVLDKQYVRLAACTPDGVWIPYDTGVDVVGNWAAPREASTAIAAGTSAAAPRRLVALDLDDGSSRTLLDPGAERYDDVTFGRIESFVADLPKGMKLDGRVYFPRNYDPDLKYPVIVYYYGGTYPITRDFGGRYPKNIWAGQDYFVYVPNPSGALGYGQEFAARHVNDWGRLTAGEVIEGTKAFLAAHPAADGARMGCIGASYGGFLTMYLITQTDMFAAAVAHAGISSLSSYWAEGYWGYGYGARALANSFPWNARELYVEQSPLFHADDIDTPLLLLHGFDDTNVPKGESDGLYIALKMLGKEVEYVQVEGQDHHILDHDRRIVWNDTILAWFARELKGQTGWWNDLYPVAD